MKKYASNEKLQLGISKGIKQLSEYVVGTLGPCGKSVLIQSKDKIPFFTKDGVSVARYFELEDPFENLGVQVLKQVAINTEKSSGDGTTTTTLLAYEIYKQAQKYIIAGYPVYEIQKGIENASKEIVILLQKNCRFIQTKEDIKNIATISANNDPIIGELIATAIDSVGKNGSIVVEDSKSYETILKLVEGYKLDAGYISPAFITDEKLGFVKYENPYVLVTDTKIDVLDDLMPTLELVARENKPLVIIADRVDNQALAALILNTTRGTLKVAAINAPAYGEEKRNILKDIALSVGASLISQETSIKIKEVKLIHLGSCKSIEILKHQSTFVDGKGKQENIQNQIELLKNEILQLDDLVICERIQQRITRLSSAIAIIKVGGISEMEVIEKKYRIDDALQSSIAAQLEGILPGGGISLLRISKMLDETIMANEAQICGLKIIKEAIKEPFRKILLNANEIPEIIEKDLKDFEFFYGYDAKEHKLVDMYASGIIDPVKVVRCSLQNAISIAISLITSNYAIVEV